MLVLVVVVVRTCIALPYPTYPTYPTLQGTAGPLKDTDLAAAFARLLREELMRLQSLHWHPSSPSAPLLQTQIPNSISFALVCDFLHLCGPDINHTPSSPDSRRPSQAQRQPRELHLPSGPLSNSQPQEQSGFPACLLTACGCALITRTSTLVPARPGPESRFAPASSRLFAHHLHLLA